MWPAIKAAVAQPPKKVVQLAGSPDRRAKGGSLSLLPAAGRTRTGSPAAHRKQPPSLLPAGSPVDNRKQPPKAVVAQLPSNKLWKARQEEKKTQQIFRGHRFVLLGVAETPELYEDISSRGGQILQAKDYEVSTHLCVQGQPDGIHISGPKVISKSWILNCCKADRLDGVHDDSLDELCKRHHQLFLCPLDQSNGLFSLSAAIENCKPKTQFLLTPGSLEHRSHVTDERLKLIIKKSYLLFRKLHQAGLTLNGKFGPENIIIHEALDEFIVRFGFLPQGAVQESTPEGEEMDVQQFEEMVRSDIFDKCLPGHEINMWLNMLDNSELKDLIIDSVLIMDLNSCSDKFTTLYDTVVISGLRDTVMGLLSHYNGWQKVVNGPEGNWYLQITFAHVENGKSGSDRYSDTVAELLRLLRNSRQHEALAESALFALVVGQHFPNLISDLQKAWFIARKNARKNAKKSNV